MIYIECVKEVEQIEKLADELLTKYDIENDVEYNFRKFGFVAKENNKYIGCITGFSYYSEITVDNLIVKKEYRGKGIGTQLVRQVEQYFKGKGFNNINLVTNKFQAPDFYKKCGFTIEFIRENKENPKFTKYFFVKCF